MRAVFFTAPKDFWGSKSSSAPIPADFRSPKSVPG